MPWNADPPAVGGRIAPVPQPPLTRISNPLLPGQQFVSGGWGGGCNRRGTSLRAVVEALDRFRPSVLGNLERLLRFAQNHHRRPSLACRNANASRQADGLRADMEGAAKKPRRESAPPACQHSRGYSPEGNEKLIHAGPDQRCEESRGR